MLNAPEPLDNDPATDKLLPFTRFQYHLPLSSKPVCTDIILGNLLSCYPLQNTLAVTIDGKVWDASNDLTHHKLYHTDITDIELENIIVNSNSLNLNIEEYNNDFCHIWKIKNFDIKQIMPKRIRSEYKTYKSKIVTGQAV